MLHNYYVDIHLRGFGNDVYYVRAEDEKHAEELAWERVLAETNFNPTDCTILKVTREG